MTGKRFTHKEDDWEILDNGDHLAYAHSGFQAEILCERLNKLNGTLTWIHVQYRQLQIDYNDCCGVVKDLRDKLFDIEEDRMELKKENQRIEDILKSSIDTEKTAFGRMVLKQLADKLGVMYE